MRLQHGIREEKIPLSLMGEDTDKPSAVGPLDKPVKGIGLKVCAGKGNPFAEDLEIGREKECGGILKRKESSIRRRKIPHRPSTGKKHHSKESVEPFHVPLPCSDQC